jgi:hypothetical protein
MTWLFRTPVRGTRSAPGLFVKAWRAPSPGNGPASRRAMKIE